jgi:hypothetical protein
VAAPVPGACTELMMFSSLRISPSSGRLCLGAFASIDFCVMRVRESVVFRSVSDGLYLTFFHQIFVILVSHFSHDVDVVLYSNREDDVVS